MPSEQGLQIDARSHGTRLLIAARSILAGWAALLAITYLVTRPLLILVAPLLGASWVPTAQLALECLALGASGWVVCRLSRSSGAVLIFAIMLAIWNFGLVPAINVPWLFQLIIDSFQSARYVESLITAAATHALLFGSMVAGARLARPRAKPISLMTGYLR
jgi:hypothetical protein